MPDQQPIITLLTDFGTRDGFAGAMKGVLIDATPAARVVDISHEIEPFNIRQAAFALLNYAPYFPQNTVHVVVVDPGVGTERRGLIVKTGDYFFVGPDNGVFSFIFEDHSFQAFRIREELFGEGVSATFHGRDIFAPAAAKLADGVPPDELGEPVTNLTSFYERFQSKEPGSLVLKVLHADHFGNLILNFTVEDWQQLASPESVKIQLARGFLYGIHRTFGEAAEGQLLALWDSSGFLQISQNKGNAAELLQMKPGDEVILKYT